jgi:hypothetical protein
VLIARIAPQAVRFADVYKSDELATMPEDGSQTVMG